MLSGASLGMLPFRKCRMRTLTAMDTQEALSLFHSLRLVPGLSTQVGGVRCKMFCAVAFERLGLRRT